MNETEIVAIVNKIEEDLYEQSDCEYYNLVFSSNGYVSFIEFLGIQIWSSDDDMREEDENGVYEPLEKYLRREINKEISKLSKIKL